MATIVNLDGKRQVRTSKLEQTLLSNRGMNIHLKRKLRIIEVDRKRTLKFVERRRKELQADLRVKKDEQFNVMLKYQIQKTAKKAGRLKLIHSVPNEESAVDIEGELFTTGLINAPGVQPRMKRLEHRRRILPEFEDDSEDENETIDQIAPKESEELVNLSRFHDKDQMMSTTIEVTPSSPKEKLNRKFQAPSRQSYEDVENPEAVVLMTSGVVSLINQNAELTLNAQEKTKEDAKNTSQTTAPHPVTGFNIHSQMRVTRTTHTSPANGIVTRREGRTLRPSVTTGNRTKSVQFSRHRGSLDGVEGLFESDRDERLHDGNETVESHKFRNRSGQSRLSLVKSKLESNEKEFLLKLRIRSQKLENEDVARKVWGFIGRRPVSMFSPNKFPTNMDDVQDDVSSEMEEERNISKYMSIASVTSKNV